MVPLEFDANGDQLPFEVPEMPEMVKALQQQGKKRR